MKADSIENSAKFSVGVLLVLSASPVHATELQGVSRLDQGEIILPSIVVQGILPGRDGPHAGKVGVAPTGKPRTGPLIAEHLARGRKVPRNGVINRLFKGNVRWLNIDTIR